MLLRLKDVHTYYGDSYVLKGVDMTVEAGQVVALLGRNGMGKTTTIRSIMGLTPAGSGTITFKDKDITSRKSYQIAKLGLGLVPQGRDIFPSLSVRENLTMAARRSDQGQGWSLESVFREFPILKERANLKGTLLSGGEQQMLAIGRALMTNPDLLLLDEPSEGLAPRIVNQVGDIILKLKARGVSILLVEQNTPMALRVADKAFIISKGKIVFDGTCRALETDEEIKIKYLCAT